MQQGSYGAIVRRQAERSLDRRQGFEERALLPQSPCQSYIRAHLLWGLLGVKVGWVEGIEVNFLGLVAGLDLRHPAVKLPGFGRVGIDDGTAVAAPAPAK